jgi:hypothetical protein
MGCTGENEWSHSTLSPSDGTPLSLPRNSLPLGQVGDDEEDGASPAGVAYSGEGIRPQHHDASSHESTHPLGASPDLISTPREIFCSVLTTVIDCSMMLPTSAFEPEEYQLNRQLEPAVGDDTAGGSMGSPKPIKVPVVRIFGPIVRRGGSIEHEDREQHIISNRPHQSACLYIHGAYPYMLARPVLAGLDGSPHTNCPWNSVAVVQRMLPALQESLEVAIQETNAFLMNNVDAKASATSKDPSNTKSTSTTAKPPFRKSTHSSRTIRRLTVVTGRGFYGYCSGPVAPFVRVEYYCPQDRWKIKRCLETGLSSLQPTELFYPQRRTSRHEMDVDETDPLSFHCFEAHIPYTMQFFKDFNLAGMSYLHVAKLGEQGTIYFRYPLPSSIRTKLPEPLSHSVMPPWVFLASNTPQKYLWNDSGSSSKRSTSSDVELDIDVASISNLLDIMTRLPSQWEERQRIHWRAVPSLREIWNQERRRMSQLLPPKEDFLSCPDDAEEPTTAAATHTPPFTLNVKPEDLVLPGATLARKGMKQLLHITDGLESSFRRVMKQIVDRHAMSIDAVDSAAMQQGLGSLPPKNLKRFVEESAEKINGSYCRKMDEGLTPTYEETVEALDALGNLVFESPSPREVLNDRSMSQESVSSFNSQTSYISSQKSQTRAQKLLTTLSQCCSVSSDEKVNDPTLLEEYVLSQRVERGDGLVGSRIENIDDVIDPETLLPYEMFDDEDDASSGDESGEEGDMKGEKIEQLLSTLATQIEEQGEVRADDSSIDSLELLTKYGASDQDVSMHSDIERLAKKKNYQNSLPAVASVSTHATDSSQMQAFPSWKHGINVQVEPRHLPPTRSGVASSSEIMTSSRMVNGSVVYEFLRRELVEGYQYFPGRLRHGFDVAPVACAPTQKSVASWYKKQRKRRQPTNSVHNGVTKRVHLSSMQENGEAQNNMLAESTSAVLMPLKLYGEVTTVEEVEWKNSQDSALVFSQGENGDLEKEPVEGKSGCKQSCNKALVQNQKSLIVDDTQGNASTPDESPLTNQALEGIGNQGGRLFVEGGGNLKAKTRHSQYGDENFEEFNDSLQCPVSIMVVEIFVQCRVGQAGISDSRSIAMTPDPKRDKISAIFYVMSEDPGGGDSLTYQERGCIFVPVSKEVHATVGVDSSGLNRFASDVRKSIPASTLGTSTVLVVECVRDERQLLLRLASIIRCKDPDMLLSWDTQASGLGYIIERGVVIGKGSSEAPDVSRELDMARLLGRTPTKSMNSESSLINRLFDDATETDVVLADMDQVTVSSSNAAPSSSNRWTGSGLGSDWDERVGAGAAAASIVSALK